MHRLRGLRRSLSGGRHYPEDEVPTEHKRFIGWNYNYFKSDADKARVQAELNAAYSEKRAVAVG